jgi:glutamate-5-semialdehyde dehydrogenase
VSSVTTQPDLAAYSVALGRRARAAARALATLTTATKDAWLHAAADTLEAHVDELLADNGRDLAAAEANGLTAAQIDRLRLTAARIRAAADGMRQVAALPDPVGRIIEGGVRPNGLRVMKVGVPLGVILFIYESRPNVTVDAAALAVKSGNAIILRGGKEAEHTNAMIFSLIRGTLKQEGLPEDSVQLVTTPDRAAVGHLLKLKQHIDLVIPRGGEGLIERVSREATMPVLKHYRGNCHVYVDRAADLDMATRIVVNAKCQRPGVCNAAESLLVHAAVAEAFLPSVAAVLRQRGVELRGCERTCNLLPDATPATEDDYAAEYLDLILSVKVVDSLNDAVEHIARYGSGHTEAIITDDLRAAERFTAVVDSSAVMVNASTRFNDGFELGLGAEIGISTDKLHARGPCGLRELTSYKYVIHGDGHVRE